MSAEPTKACSLCGERKGVSGFYKPPPPLTAFKLVTNSVTQIVFATIAVA